MNWLKPATDVVKNVTGIVTKLVPDKDLAEKLNNELMLAIIGLTQNSISRWVRAIIAIVWVTTWLYFPENFEGRENVSENVLYSIIGFYFLDFVIDRFKKPTAK